MTRKDIQTIWTKIKELHPHTPKDKIPKLTGSIADMWVTCLEGYDLNTVINAVLIQRGKKPYWPDIDEIVAELPPLHTTAPSYRQSTASAEDRARCKRDLDTMVQYVRKMNREEVAT